METRLYCSQSSWEIHSRGKEAICEASFRAQSGAHCKYVNMRIHYICLNMQFLFLLWCADSGRAPRECAADGRALAWCLPSGRAPRECAAYGRALAIVPSGKQIVIWVFVAIFVIMCVIVKT